MNKLTSSEAEYISGFAKLKRTNEFYCLVPDDDLRLLDKFSSEVSRVVQERMVRYADGSGPATRDVLFRGSSPGRLHFAVMDKGAYDWFLTPVDIDVDNETTKVSRTRKIQEVTRECWPEVGKFVPDPTG